MLKIVNYILSITVSLIILMILEMSTPLGSFIFIIEEYTISGITLQLLLITIFIAIGIEIGTWINNR